MARRKSPLLKNTEMLPCTRHEDRVRLIRQASPQDNTNMLLIDWDDTDLILSTDSYPYVWLRDNCQCTECFHSGSLSRTCIFEDLKLEVHPLDIAVKDGTIVEIIWSDNHMSHYTAEWLQARIFRKTSNQKRQSLYRLDRVLWDASFKKNIPKANFQQLLTDDQALFKWLQQLEVYGIVLIEGVPCAAGLVLQIAKRVSFAKETHYGSQFVVRAKTNLSQLSCTTGPMQLHTDMPFSEYKPGITMMHCLVQYKGNGGETQVVDAVKVALQLRDECPDMFKTLTEIPIDWIDRGEHDGKEYYKILKKPVISLDSQGSISRIDFSHHHRDSFFDVEVELASKWYEAMKFFSYLLYHPKNCIEFKMSAGSILCIDNDRLLHGRSSYREWGNARAMQTCFLDWDEARSKRRILEEKLGFTSEHLVS